MELYYDYWNRAKAPNLLEATMRLFYRNNVLLREMF
jgi:hypothetical protein